MAIDLQNLRKDDFTVDVPFGDDCFVSVAHVTRAELLKIREQATEKVLVKRGEYEQKYNAIKGDILLGKRAVRGWRGFKMGEEDLPCTPENIELLMSKWTDFAVFVNNTCSDLAKLQEHAREDAIKN